MANRRQSVPRAKRRRPPPMRSAASVASVPITLRISVVSDETELPRGDRALAPKRAIPWLALITTAATVIGTVVALVH